MLGSAELTIQCSDSAFLHDNALLLEQCFLCVLAEASNNINKATRVFSQSQQGIFNLVLEELTYLLNSVLTVRFGMKRDIFGNLEEKLKRMLLKVLDCAHNAVLELSRRN